MKLGLSKVARRPDWPLWAVAITAAWLAMVLTASVLSWRYGVSIETCLFRRITGLPCPTCGCTRAVLAAVHGQLLRAIAFNPFMFVLGAALAFELALRSLAGRRIELHLSPFQRRLSWLAAAIAFGANWVYLLIVDR